MTHEEAIKHKDIILWLMEEDNKTVWIAYKNNYNNWTLDSSPRFDINHIYIPNNEFSDLYKQQLEGKQIQYDKRIDEHSLPLWIDIDLKINDTGPINNYRAKPAVQINNGDWVVNTGTYSGIFQADEQWINDRPSGNTCKTGIDSDFELWKPKQHEMCIFYDKENTDSYIIRRYKGVSKHETLFVDNFGDQWLKVAPLELVNTLRGRL